MLSCTLPLAAAVLRLSMGSIPAPGSVPTATLPDESPVHLGIGLRIANPAELSALLARQQDPTSPDYRRFLTPEEFGERFGQPADVYERAARWLEASGFVVSRSPNRIFVEAQGTSGQVTRALSVHLLQVAGAPRSVHVPDQHPTLPAFLGPVVIHVGGLDTHLPIKHRLVGSIGQPSFGPQDLRRFYDSQPLLDNGFAGQGQQLVVLSTAETPANSPTPAAIEYFLRNISNASASFVEDVMPNPDDDFDQQGGAATEFALDVEMQSVGSPGAKSITLVVAPSSQVFTVGVNHIVNTLSSATAVSVSLGTCEPVVQMFESGLVTSFQQLLQQGLAEGQTWSAASGDNGSDDCQDGQTVAVDFPASIPEMVAMGGTAVGSPSWNGAGALTAYQTETGWNDGNNGGAGGGGFSILYSAPSYQQGFAFSGRSVPDIALISGSPAVLYDNPVSGELFPVEGTSVASPLSAGFFALIASRVGCRLGDVHRTLYMLGNAQLDGGAKVFHDILNGTTSLDGVAGQSAKVGYDSVTGWGSLDVQALAEAWPPCPGDAGVAGPAYDPCAILACGEGATCDTLTDGPSSCTIGCDPNAANSCPAGLACSQTTLFATDGGVCAPGCGSDADCASTGQVCSTCQATCVDPGTTGSAIGDACNASSDCPNGAVCTGNRGFTGNYCTQACIEGDSESAACGCPGGSVCGQVGFFNKVTECLASCTADSQCRDGYACQPIIAGKQACLPACTVTVRGGTTIDTCTEYGPNTACNRATGACEVIDGGVLIGVDAGDGGGIGSDAGADAGDGGQSVPDSGFADSGPRQVPDSGAPQGDGGKGTLSAGGCGCAAGGGTPDALWGLVGLGLLVRRRRRAVHR